MILITGKSKKSKKSDGEGDEVDGVDLPDGDEDVDIFSNKRRSAANQESGKTQQVSRTKSGGGRKK